MANEEKHSHYGHRQRLKNKVREYGLKVLADHEILELLLTYTIPRKDTNALAHTLLNKYKTLSGVLDADRSSLIKIIGVGEETALFFKVIKNLMPIYKDNKGGKKQNKITSTFDAIKYFRQHFYVKDTEFSHCICLNSKGIIIHTFDFEGENDNHINLDINDFVTEINNKNISSIILFHTHPKGDAKPSDEDLETTQRLKSVCECLSISLYDHIIFNEQTYYSMHQEHIL